MRRAPLVAVLLAASAPSSVARADDPSEVPASPQSVPTDFVALLEGGYAGQTLYGIPGSGFDASVALGGHKGVTDAGVIADFLHAETPYRISSTAVTAGAFVQFRALGRLRLGGGLRFGVLDVARITSGGSLGSGSVGVFGRLSLDLVPFGADGAGAFYVFAKGSVDSVQTELYQGVLGLGVRL